MSKKSFFSISIVIFLSCVVLNILHGDAIDRLAARLQHIVHTASQSGAELKKKYSWIFDMLPDAYQQALVDDIGKGYYKNIFDEYDKYLTAGGSNENLSKVEDDESAGAKLRKSLSLLSHALLEWEMLSAEYKTPEIKSSMINLMKLLRKSGYHFFSPVFGPGMTKGIRSKGNLDEITNNLRRYDELRPKLSLQKEIQQQKQFLTGLYKIHFMPKERDILPILDLLIKELKQDQELGGLIYRFKVISGFMNQQETKIGSSEKFSEPQYFPIIVIYPTWGRDNVQKLLDKLLVTFKDFRGNGKLPRFNTKVNDLIYYAQGDGGDKLGNLNNYFDPRYNYAVYRPDFEKVTGTIDQPYSGNEKNPYLLKIPG